MLVIKHNKVMSISSKLITKTLLRPCIYLSVSDHPMPLSSVQGAHFKKMNQNDSF